VTAKDKLSRLPADQFLDVSTDLSDEINRRLHRSKAMPFLPVRQDLIPKRNQARQKMATLPVPRFKELAMGIFLEIENRFPSIADRYNDTYRSRSKSRERSRINTSQDRTFSPSRPDQSRDRINTSESDKIARMRTDYENEIDLLRHQIKTETRDFETENQRLTDALNNQDASTEELNGKLRVVNEENKFLQDDYNDQLQVTFGFDFQLGYRKVKSK
jgi:hypothetical protein